MGLLFLVGGADGGLGSLPELLRSGKRGSVLSTVVCEDLSVVEHVEDFHNISCVVVSDLVLLQRGREKVSILTVLELLTVLSPMDSDSRHSICLLL